MTDFQSFFKQGFLKSLKIGTTWVTYKIKIPGRNSRLHKSQVRESVKTIFSQVPRWFSSSRGVLNKVPKWNQPFWNILSLKNFIIFVKLQDLDLFPYSWFSDNQLKRILKIFVLSCERNNCLHLNIFPLPAYFCVNFFSLSNLRFL